MVILLIDKENQNARPTGAGPPGSGGILLEAMRVRGRNCLSELAEVLSVRQQLLDFTQQPGHPKAPAAGV
jgi:hypothetical protein